MQLFVYAICLTTRHTKDRYTLSVFTG